MTERTKETIPKSLLGFMMIALMAFFLIPRSGVETTSDSGRYLLQSLQWQDHNGVIPSPKRGPVFPFCIHLIYQVLGVSVHSAFLCVRLFFFLSIMMCYCLAYKLTNARIAFLSCLLVMSSYGIHLTASYLLLDTCITFFVLLFLYALFVSFQNNKRYQYILSGLILAIAFLTKEVAITYLPLPMLIWFFHKPFRTKTTLQNILLFYVSFILSLLPWILYVFQHTESIHALFGNSMSYIKNTGAAYNLSSKAQDQALVIKMALNAFKYYTDHLQMCFGIITPLTIIAWMTLIATSFRTRSFISCFSSLFFINSLPLLVAIGSGGTRLGQSIFFFLFTYIILTYTIQHILVSFIHHSRTKHMILILSVLILMSIQFFSGPTATRDLLFFNGHNIYNTFFINRAFTVRGRHTSNVQAAGEWITRHVREPLIISDGIIEDAITYFTHGQYDVIDASLDISQSHLQILRSMDQLPNDKTLISLAPHPNFTKGSLRERTIFFTFEFHLLESLKAMSSSIFVLHRRSGQWISYLKQAPWAHVRFHNNDIVIFSLDHKDNIISSPHWQPLLSNEFTIVLPWYEKEFPQEFDEFKALLSACHLEPSILLKRNYSFQIHTWLRHAMDPSVSLIYFHTDADFLQLDNFPNATCINSMSIPDFNIHNTRYNYLLVSQTQMNAYWYEHFFPKQAKEIQELIPMAHFPWIYGIGNGLSIYPLIPNGEEY